MEDQGGTPEPKAHVVFQQAGETIGRAFADVWWRSFRESLEAVAKAVTVPPEKEG